MNVSFLVGMTFPLLDIHHLESHCEKLINGENFVVNMYRSIHPSIIFFIHSFVREFVDLMDKKGHWFLQQGLDVERNKQAK